MFPSIDNDLRLLKKDTISNRLFTQQTFWYIYFQVLCTKTYLDVEVNVRWNKHCFIQAFSIFVYELPEE
jgi:hypothetical protein